MGTKKCQNFTRKTHFVLASSYKNLKTMNNGKILKGLELSRTDAERLVAECAEEIGGAGLPRAELMGRIRSVLRLGAEAMCARERTVSVREAAEAALAARQGLRPVTMRDLRYYTRRLCADAALAERPLRAVRAPECRAYLERTYGHSRSAYRKARSVLHTVFAYGYRHEWCDSNPVDRVEVPKVQEQEIRPLSLAEAERLLSVARRPEHAAMRLSLHLMLFCGIRPTEVQRLNPQTDIDRQGRRVLIRPQSSKTGGGRAVPLRAGTHLLPLCIPRNWNRRWQALRRAASFSHWVPDVLRHTFATYHACTFHNLPALQCEMGHSSTALLRTRYVNTTAISPGEARRFWVTR